MRTRSTLVMFLVVVAAALPAAAEPSFEAKQNRAPRVKAARARVGDEVRAMFEAAGVRYPAAELLLRSFKRERELELWGSNRVGGAMKLIKTFPICADSGDLGPKRQAGDLQVPEGFYTVIAYNPWSSYHLSVKIDYPNRSDRIIGRRLHDQKLGWNICIHGDCVTIGCIPIEDEPMEELYLAMVDTRIRHGRTTYVHLFPSRLDDAGLERLLDEHPGDEELRAFWTNIQAGYLAFEESHRRPRIDVGGDGRYEIRARR